MTQHTDTLPIDTETTVTKPVPTGAMSTEPVITVTAITTLVSAVFAGLVLAVPGINPQWETIILTIIGAAWPIVTAVWARSKAYSPSTAQAEVNRAALTGEASDMAPPPPKKDTAPAYDPSNPDTWPDPPLPKMPSGNRKGTPMV
jgi:hypothetical protein